MQPDHSEDRTDPSPEDQIDLLLSVAGRLLAKSGDPKEFLDWIAMAGPDLAPSLAAGWSPEIGPKSHLYRALGREIYNLTPLPEHGFAPRALPRPGRNEPCACGSGRKYKHCCQLLESAAPPLAGCNMLRYVLDALAMKRFGDLPRSRVNPDAVWDTAHQWREEGDLRRVIALLEPWFLGNDRLTGRVELMFDLLMDCYLDVGHGQKRRRLVETALARGDRAVRAAALHRRAAMLFDAGNASEAWTTLAAAQREDPENPGHAFLEFTMLAAQGDYERARERARFWSASFGRRNDPDLDELRRLLRDIVADPRAALSRLRREMVPGVERLAGLFAEAPAPDARYRLRPVQGAIHELEPDGELARAERSWRKTFPQIKPELIATQHGDPAAWRAPDEWLALLEGTPLLWQSLDVLDDLAMALDAVAGPGKDELLETVLERGVALLRGIVAAGGTQEPQLDWRAMANRPALRVLAHLAHYRLEGGSAAQFIPLAELLLALNPADNHGIRQELSRAYLDTGEPEKTCALLERYPRDIFAASSLNRALALWQCEKRAEALTVLKDAAAEIEVAVKMLLARKPAKPAVSPIGITVGGKDEAWLYRRDCLALWEQNGALAWLGESWREIGARQ